MTEPEDALVDKIDSAAVSGDAVCGDAIGESDPGASVESKIQKHETGGLQYHLRHVAKTRPSRTEPRIVYAILGAGGPRLAAMVVNGNIRLLRR
jgi:hypothetical protein